MKRIPLFQKILLGLFSLTLIFIGRGLYGNFREAGSAMRNQPLAYFLSGETVERNPSVSEAAQPLPADLIIKPGTYKVYGQNYALQKDGLYLFLNPVKSNTQRIVYSGNIPALLSSLSWLTVHGSGDVKKSQTDLQNKAKNQKLSLNCGAVSLWAKNILDKENIPSRLVSTLTLGEWNSFDNGHTLLEVQIEKHWQVFDLDNNVSFTRNGQTLDFVELIKAIPTDDYNLEKIAADPAFDVNGAQEKGYDYSLYFETILGNEKNLRQWYKRILQVPLVGEGRNFYFYDEKNRAKVEAYASNYHYLPENEFMAKFYP